MKSFNADKKICMRFQLLIGLCILFAMAVANSTAMAANDKTTQQLLDWILQNTLGAYEKIGNTSSNWDAPAKRALIAYAKAQAEGNLGVEQQIIATNSEAAIEAGCNDPLIAYLYTRYGLIQKDLMPKVFGSYLDSPGNGLAMAFCKDADALNQSQYPYLCKYYSSLWAAVYLKLSNTSARNPATSLEVSRFEKTAVTNLVLAVSDKTMPAGFIYAGCEVLFNNIQADKTGFESVYEPVEAAIFNNHERYVGLLVRGMFCINAAWESRGGDTADKVTVSGWRYFFLRLDAAQQALEEAWRLNPTEPLIATKMITVELGQGKGRDRMEMWFERAMSLDTNNAAACSAKLYYLEPRWYGTNDEALAFGRECLHSAKWGGGVPLVVQAEYDCNNRLVDLFYRQELQSHIGKGFGEVTAPPDLPEDLKHNFTWDEVDAAYQKYLKNQPDDLIERQQYICFAAKAERWDIVNAQLPLIGNVHSVEIFGRDYLYNQMVQKAKDALNPNPKSKITPPRISAVRLGQLNQPSVVGTGAKVTLQVILQPDCNFMLSVDKRLLQVRYQWRLNGTNIVNGTNQAYIIQSATPQDAGEYSVVASNGGGNTMVTNGVLRVNPPWEDVQTPKQQEALAKLRQLRLKEEQQENQAK
jgi:hypothetical protein